MSDEIIKINNSSQKQKSILGKFWDFIDFIFGDEIETDYDNQALIETEKEKLEVKKSRITSQTDEYSQMELAFGKFTADYIIDMRNQVDFLVKEHNLSLENSIKIIIPPGKISQEGVPPAVIDNMIEGIYSQYDSDIILKPGIVKILGTDKGAIYAEIYIDCYTVSNEVLPAS